MDIKLIQMENVSSPNSSHEIPCAHNFQALFAQNVTLVLILIRKGFANHPTPYAHNSINKQVSVLPATQVML